MTLEEQDRQKEALQAEIDSLKDQIAEKQQEIHAQQNTEESKQQ